ncbi:MAG TPA: AMP-binding protein [Gaiellaceae bacterium]|nr:AMP-binding protein [Gaiellaceae bacterium]
MIRTELIRPVGELLAAHSPERVALEDGELQVTYGELELRTRRLAAHLAAAGIEPGDRVATYMANGVRGAEAQLAAVRAGAIAVPINPAAPAAEAGFMLADSGARALVVDPERRHELGGASELALVAVAGESYEELVSSDAPGRAEPGDLDAPAWMLYTSGTTGRPKGVLLSQRGLLWVAACWGSIVGISDEDVILSPLPQFHSYCTELHLAALAAGARVRITRRFSTSETLDLLASRPFTLLAGVPTMFHYLLEAGRKQGLRCPTLARCVSAGAILPAALSDEFERTFGVLLLDGYGITETSTFVTMNWPTGTRPRGSCGLPLPGTAVRLVDPATGEDVEPGRDGEIHVRGPHVMLGYWNRPEETKAALAGGWYRTGDLGRLDENGYLTITGRIKELIIRGGENVYPAEVEAALISHESLRDCAVVGRPHEALGEVVVAFVVPVEPETFDPAPLVEHCARLLAPWKVPSEVRVIDEIPRTGSGKIMRHRLPVEEAASAG